MTEKRKVLRWRKERDLPGLMSIGQPERGWELTYGGEEVGGVSASTKGWDRETRGWFWSVPSNDALGIKHRNSAAERRVFKNTDAGKEAAKAECEAYVREALGLGVKR